MIQLLADASAPAGNPPDAYFSGFVEIARYIGVPGALCFVIIFALHKGWIVLGRELLEAQRLANMYLKERDEMKQLWLIAIKAASNATSLSEKLADRGNPTDGSQK